MYHTPFTINAYIVSYGVVAFIKQCNKMFISWTSTSNQIHITALNLFHLIHSCDRTDLCSCIWPFLIAYIQSWIVAYIQSWTVAYIQSWTIAYIQSWTIAYLQSWTIACIQSWTIAYCLYFKIPVLQQTVVEFFSVYFIVIHVLIGCAPIHPSYIFILTLVKEACIL